MATKKYKETTDDFCRHHSHCNRQKGVVDHIHFEPTIGPPGSRGPKGDPGCPGAKGDMGYPGPKGAKGDRGTEGARGPRGFQGVPGDKGDPGCKGPAGPRGPIGPEGGQGPQGVRGDIGAQGEPGYPGPMGPRGNTGPEGPAGIRGPVGAKGDPGARGAIGPTGPEGPQGIQGIIGPCGPMGPEGSEGQQGPQGPQGSRGCPGPEGPQGLQGDIGTTGAMGDTGPTGPVGDGGFIFFTSNTPRPFTNTNVVGESSTAVALTPTGASATCSYTGTSITLCGTDFISGFLVSRDIVLTRIAGYVHCPFSFNYGAQVIFHTFEVYIGSSFNHPGCTGGNNFTLLEGSTLQLPGVSAMVQGQNLYASLPVYLTVAGGSRILLVARSTASEGPPRVHAENWSGTIQYAFA